MTDAIVKYKRGGRSMTPCRITILKISFIFIFLGKCSANESEENAMVSYLANNNLLHGKAEIVFLLDRSGSVGAANFEAEKGFVESFLTHIVVDVNATRVAVISYSDSADRHIDYLREPKTKCFLSQELQDVTFKDSAATNIAAALEEARLVLENARPNVNKVVILISDGLATKGGDPTPFANRLKSQEVQIFAFGIGKFLKTELEHLASSPQHTYQCSGFKAFKRLARKIRGDPHESSWSGQALKPNCDHLCDSPYRGEPDDPGCCDQNARCSCALLSGMHNCACGPGYYGLSGLMEHCRACPRGTYKSEIKPSSSCTPCVLGATTADVASTSIKDCYCKEGFYGDPTGGNLCKKVKCPPLQKPKNGYLLGNCESTYWSTCYFTCGEGYELLDSLSDTRTCQSNGEWSGKEAVCVPIRCRHLEKPQYGSKYCDKGDLTVGKKCRFQCLRGYILNGSHERECLPSKHWSGKDAKCLPVECSIPPTLKHGRLFSCKSNEKPAFLETCLYRCNEGFQLRGPTYLVCRENGFLLDQMGRKQEPSCKDITEPEIHCPGPYSYTATKGMNGASVTWEMPHLTDNSGIEPKLISDPPNARPPAFLTIGVTSIRYTAIDHAGLQQTCNIWFEIIDVEPPTVIRCPTNFEVSTNDVETSVVWDEPLFADNSGGPIIIKQKVYSGDVFRIGRHRITYEAMDKSRNTARCVFDVFVSRTTCPYYPAPTNGALTCNDWLYGQFCQVMCNEKYDFVEKPAEWYVCNGESEWVTIPERMSIPWPDCAKPAIPSKVRHMMKGHYYRGDCNDPRVQYYLQKVFLNHFTEEVSRAELCGIVGSCSLRNVKVMCGKITNRRRRDLWQDVDTELELEFEITINVNQELNDTEAILKDFLETIRNLNWDVEDDMAVETTTLNPSYNVSHLDEKERVTRTLVLSDDGTLIVCKPGSVLSDNICVLCAPGTFYDSIKQLCLECPLGYYQDKEGKLECEKCPDGMSTENNRTRNRTDCKGICLPGTYSSSGLDTCMVCPVGKFQEHAGQSTCNSCPRGTTTENVGSNSEADCKAACLPGSFSNNGLNPCDLCPKGFYQTSFGQKNCLECQKEFSTVATGSTAESDCLDLDPCLNKTICLNKGHCRREGREAVCVCKYGFEGDRCETDINECMQNPCLNNASCINTEGSFSCNCSPGFTGTLCELEVDECISDPCVNNGTCLDKVNGFICVCPTLYEGETCEVKREICFRDVICLNGGTCEFAEDSNDTICVCPIGYGGIDCSLNHNDCENITCQNNGSCIDGIASYTCACVNGYTGMLCETEVDECENNICRNGSTCKDLVGFYECICPPGWSGAYCEIKLSSDFVLMFPEATPTIANMAATTLSSPMSNATISMWVQTTDIERSGTPMSYAVATTSTTDGDGLVIDNALTISDCSGIRIYVNNEPLVTDLQVADGQWHHLAFTWSSENSGTWALYKDGQIESQGTSLKPNDIISGGGTMVIGQEQDTVGGGFSPIETFTGNITRVNVWNSYFSKNDISRLCNMEDDLPGKVIAWPDFLQGVRGDVHILKNERPTFLTNDL